MIVMKTASWSNQTAQSTNNVTRDARGNRAAGVEVPQSDLEDLSSANSSRPVYVLSGLGWRYG